MEEVRQLVQEEGREARNLVAFHVAVDTPNRVARKPPRGAPPPRRLAPRSATRLRSASAGRDKRSELRARYWALLFGDLQRSVGEIYNTVESHENQNECQEVILVLENYTRDFKALSEWFRLKWEYDNTPPPQRPQSLAWEIRKTDFVRPESRCTHSVKSSPSVSGKNSPCLSGHNSPSGKNSPNLTGKPSPGSGKISPRISGHCTSPKASIEFFSNKIASKTATKPEPKVVKESRLSDIKEKDTVVIEDDKNMEKGYDLKEKDDEESAKTVVEIEKSQEVSNAIMPKNTENVEHFKQITEPEKSKHSPNFIVKNEKNRKEPPKPIVEIGKAKEIPNATPIPVIVKTTKRGRSTKGDNKASPDTELYSQGKATTAKLEAMENEFLSKNLTENAAKNENLLNQDFEKHESASSRNPPASLTKETAAAESSDKNIVIPESPAKTDKFCNTSTESSISISDDPKPGEVILNADNKAKSITAKKKDAVISTPKKDPASKTVKEVLTKDAKISEAREKKESNIKAPKETNLESLKKDDSSKEKHNEQKLNQAEDSEAQIKRIKDAESIVNQVEIKESVPDGEKSENKSPEPSNDSNDIKEDKDSKKVEPKPVEARPPARPAYSQAAAKPKLVTVKDEIKTPTKSLYRSKTVIDIRSNSAPNRQLRQFPNRSQKSKCSYPFNLTTGRTSLFDAPGAPKVIVTKKPTNRSQLAAGDVRNQIKPDLKTRPPRPNSLKLNEQGDTREKTSSAFENIKDCDEYSSTDTIVTQIDLSRIESSDSLKTIVPEYDVANSIEVLNVENKTDNEGWLTVKSRRLSRESKKSKSHWANRFHQPSATTSLPTLNMIESPKSESNPIAIDSKLDRAKSEQPQHKPEKAVKVTAKKEPKATSIKDNSMIRQKSDVTGLRTRTSRNKALKKDKNRDKKDSELTKNRLHSSLESLTTGLARSQESTEEDAFNFDKWKAEFRTTFKYLEEDDQMTNHNEILKTADPSEMSEIAEMTSQIEENERKISLALDFQSEADQRKLCQEEDLLNRQIMELQLEDNDVDTETDDTETDAEILCEEVSLVPCQVSNLNCRDITSCLEQHYESALQSMSWSERVDALGALKELVSRDPGRAQKLHSKLSQGIKRRGSLQDILRRLQAKQARAETQRMLLHTERAKKIHQLLGRVEEVKMAKNQLIDEKRNRMERRLQKAAENRDQHIKDIVRKAHDEEEKLREIAFIKQLEAENRRHEFLDQCRSLTTRLREMRRERLDKLEQKAAREAAVGARRQALEAARKLHVETLLEKRKERDARREELMELKRQERDDAAREKAEGVKSRLSALAAAAELEADALRSRIRDKQDASQQRLESHLQAIREKATGPRQPTTSESQDQNSTANEEDEEVCRLEQERKEREKQKVLRKKARKLKQKIIALSKEEYPVNNPIVHSFISPVLGKMQRIVNQLAHLVRPLLLDCKPATNQLNGHQPKQIDSTPKPEFKYDFEDKMGKKKKKKKSENSQTQKNKGNEPKRDYNKNIDDVQNNDYKNNAQQINDIKTLNHIEPNGTSNGNNIQITIQDSQMIKNDPQNAQIVKNLRNDAQRLSKSNSICSSVSDMSKASTRYEQPILSLDVPLVEKLVGELYRIINAKDANENLRHKAKLADMKLYSKLHAVRTLGQLLSLLAERDDLLNQLSYKCVAMCVGAVTRLVVSCSVAGLYFFNSPAAVHCITLLYVKLGKDLSDPKEMDLAKQLSDLVSVTLDAGLCESRLRSSERGEGAIVTAIRARAHSLISYLCMLGCITRAEHSGEARERVQALVTLCADMCQPHECDAGPERGSALQSLRSALGTSIMGARAEFCMLFEAGAALSRAQDFVRAARTTHLLRQIAELDHQLVQDAFGEGGWPLEFRAAVARLLSQHAPNDKEAPNSGILNLCNQRLDQNISQQMVLDLIVLVGYVVVNNPQLHDTICENWGVIKTLCTLPANWLVSEFHSPSLLPTLVVLADRPQTARVIYSELSVKMLNNYINSPEGQKMKMIQILKAAREKSNKKDKQGKKEKQHNSAGDNHNGDNDITNTGSTDSDDNLKVLTNGVKNEEASVSDPDSIEDEV